MLPFSLYSVVSAVSDSLWSNGLQPTRLLVQGILHASDLRKLLSVPLRSQGHCGAFELWCWRRFLRVPWTAWRSNQSILKDPPTPTHPHTGLHTPPTQHHLGMSQTRHTLPRRGCFPLFFSLAAKLLQSCPTLCDPIDGSLPGSPTLGFSRQEHWSGLPFPSPMHESEK